MLKYLKKYEIELERGEEREPCSSFLALLQLVWYDITSCCTKLQILKLSGTEEDPELA